MFVIDRILRRNVLEKKIEEKILEDCERSVFLTEERVFDYLLYISIA